MKSKILFNGFNFFNSREKMFTGFAIGDFNLYFSVSSFFCFLKHGDTVARSNTVFET